MAAPSSGFNFSSAVPSAAAAPPTPSGSRENKSNSRPVSSVQLPAFISNPRPTVIALLNAVSGGKREEIARFIVDFNEFFFSGYYSIRNDDKLQPAVVEQKARERLAAIPLDQRDNWRPRHGQTLNSEVKNMEKRIGQLQATYGKLVQDMRTFFADLEEVREERDKLAVELKMKDLWEKGGKAKYFTRAAISAMSSSPSAPSSSSAPPDMVAMFQQFMQQQQEQQRKRDEDMKMYYEAQLAALQKGPPPAASSPSPVSPAPPSSSASDKKMMPYRDPAASPSGDAELEYDDMEVLDTSTALARMSFLPTPSSSTSSSHA